MGKKSKHIRITAVQEGHLVGQGLPLDMIISPRIVISRRAGEQIARLLKSTPQPTKQLRALMSGDVN